MTTTHPSRYLVALVDGGGTVPPELGAVRALVARGHEVTVLAEDSTEADVWATGATFRPWVQGLNRPDRRPEHDPYRDWEVTNPLKLFARLVDTQFVGPAPGTSRTSRRRSRPSAPTPCCARSSRSGP